jgi:CO/xanthine dehydrogenase FAD-binding subunit
MPVAELFVGPFFTALGERDLITEIALPAPPPGSGSAYVSVEHPASGFALAGAAAVVHADGSSRVALTGVGAASFLLEGDVDDAEIYGDRFAPEEYRRRLAQIVVQRAVETASRRAEEDTAWTA